MVDIAEHPLFSATLQPHRSLHLRGARLIMAIVAGASAFASIPFIWLGFWPVAGFYGVDVLLLYFALRASFVQARAYEHVLVSPVELRLLKVDPAGRASEWRFNPAWTRLYRDIHEDFGVQRLSLVSRGESVAIAAFLSADEKASFGDALGSALAQARRGTLFNP